MNEQLMTVDHFGSGGRRSDSRLGRRGKKLGESGKVAKSRFLKFLDFSWISLLPPQGASAQLTRGSFAGGSFAEANLRG